MEESAAAQQPGAVRRAKRPAGAAPVAAGELGGKLAGKSLAMQVFILAIWPFFEQLLNFMVNFVDMAIAGHISEQAAAAVAVTAYVQWFLGLINMGVGQGAGAIVARATGAQRMIPARAALGQSLTLGLIGGVITGALLVCLSPAIGQMCGTDPQTVLYGTQYTFILALAAPFSALLFVGSACLRAGGDTRSPFLLLLIVNIVNTGLSVWLVTSFDLEVVGIAVGTAVAWVLGAGLMFLLLALRQDPLHLRIRRMKPHWHTMKRILRIGVFSLLESGGMWLANMTVLLFVRVFLMKDALMAAHGAAIRIEAISFMPGFAIGIAASTLAGQYLGAQNVRKARQSVLLCLAIGCAIMTIMGLVFWFFPEELTRLVIDPDKAPAVYEQVPALLKICAVVQLPFAVAIVLGLALRGTGDTTLTMIITLCSSWLVRVPGALLMIHWGFGLEGVWFVLCGEWLVRGGLFLLRFLQGGWQKVKV